MNIEAEQKIQRKLRQAKHDPACFAETYLGLKPFPYQMEFLRDTAERIAACCGRKVGKTTLSAIRGLHFAFFNAGVTVLIVSATLRQSMILFGEIQRMVESSALVRLKVKASSRTTVEFDHGSRIVALPCGPTGYSLRGYNADMVILDEANFVREEVVNGVIRPMLIARPRSCFIMVSTPWSRNHPFYRAIEEKDSGFHVYRWPSRLNPLVTQEKLDDERKSAGELIFRREYEAQFVEESSCYFPHDLILQCVDGDYELLSDEAVFQGEFEGSYHLGVDFGKRVDHTVLAVLEKSTDRVTRLVYLKQLPLGTLYSAVTGWIRRLNASFRFSTVTLDQTGVGEAPLEDVKAFLPRAEGIILSSKTKLDVLSNLRLVMEHKRLLIPLDRELVSEMNGEHYEMSRTGELLFSHPAGSHDDQLWALALSAWGARISHPTWKPITRSF